MCFRCDNPNVDYMEHVRMMIDQYGWMIQGVGEGEETFSYTVGLTAFGLPELIMNGLDPREAKGYLNALATILTSPDTDRDGFIRRGKPLCVLPGDGSHRTFVAERYMSRDMTVAKNLYEPDRKVVARLVRDAPRRLKTRLRTPFNVESVERSARDLSLDTSILPTAVAMEIGYAVSADLELNPGAVCAWREPKTGREIVLTGGQRVQAAQLVGNAKPIPVLVYSTLD